MSDAIWQTYLFIAGYYEANGYGPSLREIALALDCALSTAHARITRLRAAGLVEGSDGIARSARPASSAPSQSSVVAMIELAEAFELASLHDAEFICDGTEATAEIEHALRAAAFKGYALGLRRAAELTT